MVLKTVIAEDAAGERTHGRLGHPRDQDAGRAPARRPTGATGWTVTWKGRGWDRSFDDYLALVRVAGDLTRAGALLAVPSVKYHLPRLDEPFRDAEYRHTTRRLAGGVGRGRRCRSRRISRPRSPATRWPTSAPASSAGCARCPARSGAAAGATAVRLALKLMNARFDDAFQREMMAAAAAADALVCFNRLWDAGGAAWPTAAGT